MLTVVRYEDRCKKLWDEFIERSKNGVFFFHRDYMEYHADRFTDFSLMFFNGKKLLAVMPANIRDNMVVSHEGLTFGGIISDNKMKTNVMLEIFEVLKEFLNRNGVIKMIYKAIPYIYHTIPADEDLYALHRNHARLIRRDVSSTIDSSKKLEYTKKRRQKVRRSMKNDLIVSENRDFKDFMILKGKDLKEKHGLSPVHTPEEMELLANRFPDNIKLFTVKKAGEMVSGMVMYESKNVAHGQYMASSNEGKKLLASDFLHNFLINDYYKEKKFFDCGISTEDNGRYLNEGLIYLKESFGARAINYDFYEMDL